ARLEVGRAASPDGAVDDRSTERVLARVAHPALAPAADMDDVGVPDQHEALAATGAALDRDHVRALRQKLADGDGVHVELAQQPGKVAGKLCLGPGDAGVADSGLQCRNGGCFVHRVSCPIAGERLAHAPTLKPRSSGSAGSASALGRPAGPNRLLWTL